MSTDSSKPIRIFIVDDHALFREGLLRLLGSSTEIQIVGNAASFEEALEKVPTLQIDVLILDYDLGTETAVQLVHELRAKEFQGRILIVTAGLPDRAALDLIRSGVSGIFHKQHSPVALERSIQEVAEGRVLIEQSYLQGLVTAATDNQETGPRLTEREQAIMRFLVEGLANKEIAAQLQISESAVKATLQQLFGKTGVRTRGQLVRIALEKYRDVI